MTHRGHQGVEDADSEGCATSEGLGEIQLSVRVIVIILIQELDIAVIDQLCDHGHAGAKDHPSPLQHNCVAQRTPGGRRDGCLGKRPKGVVEGHRLDVQCRKDCLLVRKVGIIAG